MPTILKVSFDASQSSDPDGDALTHEWSFDDGSPPAFGRAVVHTYAGRGSFFPSLTVTDARGGASQVNVRIDPGHEPPRVTVLSPSDSARFRVGQPLTLRASAVDENGEQVSGSQFNWTALLHHNNHTHPYLSAPSEKDIVIPAPAPEDLPAADTSYLELRLTVRDGRGLQTTVVRNVLPQRVKVTFATVPSGLRLNINGASLPAPRTFTSWAGYRITVDAPDQTDTAGRQRVFNSWSDGGAQTHVVITPATAKTYQATFR